jgi:hypothetical protein
MTAGDDNQKMTAGEDNQQMTALLRTVSSLLRP